MTGGVRLEFPAKTMSEAVTEATARFRELMEDPEIQLPWSAHFEFQEDLDERARPLMMVQVRIEFDRKDPKLTSATV